MKRRKDKDFIGVCAFCRIGVCEIKKVFNKEEIGCPCFYKQNTCDDFIHREDIKDLPNGKDKYDYWWQIVDEKIAIMKIATIEEGLKFFETLKFEQNFSDLDIKLTTLGYNPFKKPEYF